MKTRNNNQVADIKYHFLCYLLFVTCYLLSAQTENPKAKPHTKASYYVSVNIDITYKDKQGNDLLDSTNDKHYSAKDITLYYVEKGEKIKIDKPRMDHPNDHFIYRSDETKTNNLRVFLEHEEVLVQLDAKITDTIKCKIKKEKGSTVVEKVWYNGKLEWERGKNKSQVITIIK